MRLYLLTGGFGGFLIALGTSLHAGTEASYALRDGAVGCVTGALILRCMYLVVMASVRSRLMERSLAGKVEHPTLSDTTTKHPS